MPAVAPLRRSLSLRDLIVYGLLFIGPLAPVGVFGVLDARTDGAVATVYGLATLAMAFTAWSYARMSRVIPQAGSVFAYASAGLGPTTGFLAGWLAMLDYLLIPAVAYLFSGIAMHALVPPVPAWVFTLAAFLLTTTLNLAGVSAAARVGTVVLVVEILVLILFVAFGAFALLTHGPVRGWLTPVTGLVSFYPTAIAGAVSIAVLSFLGFDAIASFAEEHAGDSRQVGLAILTCLTVAGVLFVVQTSLGAWLSSTTPGALVAHPERQGTAFYDLTRQAIGPWMATVMALTKAIGPAFAAMTAQAAAARLLFGMARDGRLPGALARVDARTGTPTASLVFAAALTLVVSVWAARRDDGLDVLVSVVDVGALAAFTLLHASVVGYFAFGRGRDGLSQADRVAHIMVPVAGACVSLGVIAASGTLAKLVAGVWLVAGLATAFFMQDRNNGLNGERPQR